MRGQRVIVTRDRGIGLEHDGLFELGELEPQAIACVRHRARGVKTVEQIVAQLVADAVANRLDIDRGQACGGAATPRAGVGVERLEAAALKQQHRGNG